MSKWIEENLDGTLQTTIADPEGCAWMFNEVCCNDQCEELREFVTQEYCDTCPLFTPEEEER